MTDPENIRAVAEGLSEAQKRAILAIDEDNYARAKDLGVSGNTLASLNGVGGVDPKTLLLGPILVTYEFTGEGRFWRLTEEGLAVRSYLGAQEVGE